MFSDKRLSERSSCRLPLLMAWEYPENFSEVIASNVSDGGMCIESLKPFYHGVPLYIKSAGQFTGKRIEGSGEAYVGNVRWTRRSNDSYRFDMGIQYMSRCRLVDRVSDYCDLKICDMCGDNIEAGLHSTRDHLHLCTECFWNIGVLGKSITQSSIIRFLSGNVF